MSCSARLPVYALFAGVFFPHSQATVVFSLYVAGIVLALLVTKNYVSYNFESGKVYFRN